MQGSIDEVRLWQRDLSWSESIREARLLNPTTDGQSAELTAHWDAATASAGATSLSDTSGYGRTLTVSGSATTDGEAIVLDGTDDAASSDAVVDDTGSFTVTTVVSPDLEALAQKGAGYVAQVVGKRDKDATSNWGIFFEVTGTSPVAVETSDGDIVEKTVATGFWHFGRYNDDGTFTSQVSKEATTDSGDVRITGVFNQQDRTAALYLNDNIQYTTVSFTTDSGKETLAVTGSSDVTQSKTVSLYLLGMDGDKTSSGTRSVTETGIEPDGLTVADITDSEPYAGFLREQITYNGSTPVSAVVNTPWKSKTATQHKSYADIESYFVRTEKTATHTYLTGTASWRTASTETTYDAYGMATTVQDNGDTSVDNDQTCTRTWYARNDTAGINSLVSRTRTVGRVCSAAETDLSLPTSSSSRGDVLSDTATVYDNTSATTWSASQTPTKGDVSWTGRASAYPASATSGERHPSSWQTTGTATYDTLGRTLTATDVGGSTTSNTYTPTTAGPLTRTKVTNAAGHSTYTYTDPVTGQPVKLYDANLKKTELTYDALGRLTAVWMPNRSQAAGQGANKKFAYHVTNDEPSWTSTSTLKADGTSYDTTYTIYDALLRELQTQSPAATDGRLLTDTRYDTRGLAYETHADIYDTTSEPNGTYTRAEYGEAPSQTETVYDGAGRAVESTFLIGGVKQWSTTASYTGDATATTAVEGGSATRVFTDAHGRTTERREYAGTSPTGSTYTSTKYTYTRDGLSNTITGTDGEQWSYGYDLFGRQTTATDPDTGTTTTTYTALDETDTTTDARGEKLLYAYDKIGRATGVWQTSKTDANKLTAYAYDTLAKGQLDSTTRYVGGTGGDAYTDAVVSYDNLYQVTESTFSLPTDSSFVTSGAVASKLTYKTDYNVDGTVASAYEPAAGGLDDEYVSTTYTDSALPKTVSGASGYLLGASYSALGQTEQLTLGASSAANTPKAYVTNTWEEGTGRLTESHATTTSHSYMLQDLKYGYDDAGNVLSISDPTTLGGTSEADNQCFTYDGYGRLTEAWTPKTADCSTSGRTTSNLDGASPYWTSYTYNNADLRTTETDHTAAGSTTQTYCYDSQQLHALLSTTTSGNCLTAAEEYDYNSIGATTTRPDDSATQSLTWNSEGKLATLTESGTGAADGTTEYVYDADGNLLIRGNAEGESVLYLGATEVHYNAATGDAWGQRYYTANGTRIAVRTNESGTEKLSFLAGDAHGTSTLAVASTTDQTVTKRYFTPFGETRGGGTGTWMDDKSFLGKTTDDETGLTHVGAREYDSSTGRFISVDPVLDTSQHESLNGYSYANNSPVTYSDPTGLWIDDGTGHNEPRPGGGGGGQSSTPGVPPGGTGADGCYYTCGTADSTNNGTVFADPFASPLLTSPLTNVPEPELKNWVAQAEALQGQEIAAEKEVALAGCGWVPVVGLGCDIYDIKRSWSEGDTLGVVTGIIGVLPLGDFAKAPHQVDNVADAVKGAKKKATGCKCFLAGTDVLMADGTTKDIEDVELGDKVQATDPETGESGPREVTRLIVTEDDKHFNELSIATEDGVEQLTATHEHPFWSPSENEWTEAGALKPGMTLLTDEGATVIVTGNRAYTERATTFNLTVDDLHTYYVLAGETPVLVHNSTCDVPSGSLQGQKLADQLRKESASSPFTPGGFLEPEAIANSRMIMRGSEMKNKALRARFEERGGVSQWGKYSTETHQSPYGDYQVHYYMNRTSGEVMYGFDYKVVMNRR